MGSRLTRARWRS